MRAYPSDVSHRGSVNASETLWVSWLRWFQFVCDSLWQVSGLLSATGMFTWVLKASANPRILCRVSHRNDSKTDTHKTAQTHKHCTALEWFGSGQGWHLLQVLSEAWLTRQWIGHYKITQRFKTPQFLYFSGDAKVSRNPTHLRLNLGQVCLKWHKGHWQYLCLDRVAQPRKVSLGF